MVYGNSIVEDLRYRFREGDMVTKLIFLNVGIFFFINILKLGFFLFQNNTTYSLILHNLSLPASLQAIVKQPWAIFSYMFVHEGFFHIIFNMLWLYWFGEIFVLYLGDKKILPLYLLGGICGALFYVASFNLIPVFKTNVGSAVLIGASASVLAIVFGAVALNPNHQVRIILLGDVRIKYIALFTLLIDIISIPRGNAGGYIAHLGGAFCGWLFIRALRNGIDISQPITKVAEVVSAPFEERERVKILQQERIKNLREHAIKPSRATSEILTEQERLDSILDQISRSGYDSLSDADKKFLFEYSNK
ncbi:MAG: rhomboid family intramembrane serine protease [Chitinophagales bacterium]|nr:rhomboid family intramembrane serine protease [Chitinophagales bacterium]